MLFDSCCIFRLMIKEPRSESQDRSLSPFFSFLFLSSSESQQSSILLSSLSIYFFQYVKERYPYLSVLALYPIPFRKRRVWWRITDSNRWPPACKAGALASWANPPKDYVDLWLVNYWLVTFITNLCSLISDRLYCSPEQIWTADPYIISVVL
jgi:hypothetical protein